MSGEIVLFSAVVCGEGWKPCGAWRTMHGGSRINASKTSFSESQAIHYSSDYAKIRIEKRWLQVYFLMAGTMICRKTQSLFKQAILMSNFGSTPNLGQRDTPSQGLDLNLGSCLLNVKILDSTGRQPYRGDVYIEGERIMAVSKVVDLDSIRRSEDVRIIDGRGRTVMSGLGDAHTHLSWNNNALDLLGNVGVEEHTLITARSALCYLDSGYTMCYGAASAKDRLDCVIRDAINNGDVPGPRYLANGREIAKREGELAAGITAFADGPLEMREVIRHHTALGVDQIKLSMSGEAITKSKSAEECFYTDQETAACVDEAHRNGLRVCAHARAKDSVIQCVKHGVDVIYHASYTDPEGMKMLVENKERLVVAPAIKWLYATVHDAEPFGYTFEKAEEVGYKKELDVACQALKEMHKKGITVLPGGDYGFAWCPHGTYARDLEHFVKLLDFTPMESIIAATAGVARLFMQEYKLGKILPGYYADCILVDGDPLKDISVLQDHDKLDVIVINGRIHKSSPADFVTKETRIQPQSKPYFNFVAFEDEVGRRRIGHLDFGKDTIETLAMASGSPLSNMHEVIALANDVVKTGHSVSVASVRVLAPIDDRDVLCVGNNYVAHTQELKGGTYDNGQGGKNEFPAIFTKRSTSIIATNESIYAHPDYTSTLDYEGEIGVIIGKTGSAISEEDAKEHIWGYTIINDISAREKQRDHGQFLMGKSPDTFCPMGPVAVPAASLPAKLRVQTFVNSEKRQDGTSDLMITSIAKLISIISQGLTLHAGDVIATGTPAGVGPGMQPPRFSRPGDLVEVEVTGLGRLSNRVTEVKPQPRLVSSLPIYNMDRSWNGSGLTQVGNKWMNVRDVGSGPDTIVLIHGLGGSLEYYEPIMSILSHYRVISYDLEGHGLSSTQPSLTTLESYVQDLKDSLTAKDIRRTTIVGWSSGGLIAMLFAEQNLPLVQRLVLLGPGPNPFPLPAAEMFRERAAAVRENGMEATGIAKTVAKAATSHIDDAKLSAVRQSLLATHPEGYDKGCIALAESVQTSIRLEELNMPVLIVAGKDDNISSMGLAKSYVQVCPMLS